MNSKLESSSNSDDNHVAVASNWHQTDGLEKNGILSLHPWDHKLLDDDIPKIVNSVFIPMPRADFFEKAPQLASCVFSSPYSTTVLSTYRIPTLKKFRVDK